MGSLRKNWVEVSFLSSLISFNWLEELFSSSTTKTVTFLAAKMDCAKGMVMVQEKTKNNMVAINFTGAKLRAVIDFYK
jgi:hypothetical protein